MSEKRIIMTRTAYVKQLAHELDKEPEEVEAEREWLDRRYWPIAFSEPVTHP